MKRTLTFFAILSVLLLSFGCSDKNKGSGETVTDSVTGEEAEHHEHATDVTTTEAGKPQFTVDEIFKSQIESLFTAYVNLKDAFVSSDADKVKKEAENTLKRLNEVDMKLVTGAAHNDWMVYQQKMKGSLQTIQSASDIEVQRQAFSELTDPLYKSIKAFGLAGSTAYYEFCPMAFDDAGAYWLSDNSAIRNPYFGDKMLTCGEVKEKLK